MRSSSSIRLRGLGTLVLLTVAVSAQGQSVVVSPFAGSELHKTYESRFELLPLLTGPLDAKGTPSTIELEGSLVSNIYLRPADVSSYEVYQSYLASLRSGGFDILLDCREKACAAKRTVASVYRQANPIFKTRNYQIVKKQSGTDVYLTSQANHYISAKKEEGGQTHYVMVIVSDAKQLYSADVLSLASLEEGTTSITEKMLTDGIAANGKVVLSGIFFDTGKDTLTDASTPALETIAGYLKAHPEDTFYVVGHTDDTGGLEANLALSARRAKSVVASLAALGVDVGRLSGHGVGPFAPAASNTSDQGRGSNRRVELVLSVP